MPTAPIRREVRPGGAPPGSPPEPPPCAYWVSHEITASLQGLAIGAPQVHRNLALFPLLAPAGAGGAYVLLDEALADCGSELIKMAR